MGTIATVPIAGVRAFPAPVRFTGLSFAYNMSYAIFGGLTPVILTLWLQKRSDGARALRARRWRRSASLLGAAAASPARGHADARRARGATMAR